jgi:hypothetical protein
MIKIIKYSCLVGDYDIPVQDGRIYVQGSTNFKSNNLNAKITKILPQLYLEQHDYSLWIDANIVLKVNPLELIEMMGDFECLLVNHPVRTTINEEIIACAKLDSKSNLEYHKDKEGALASCGMILRKNTQTINQLNCQWFAEICRGSFRDQLSFPYTLGTKSLIINGEWSSLRENKIFKINPHK